MSKTTKFIFVLGIVLLTYGYLSRVSDIYFFWDSKSFGWILMAVGLMGYLFDLNKSRRIHGKRTFWIKMGIGLMIFAFALSGVIIFEFKYNSEAYQTAIDYIKNDSILKSEMGDLKGFGLFPTGSQTTNSYNGAESGNAVFLFTVMGTKKYRDVEINLVKTPETTWTVSSFK